MSSSDGVPARPVAPLARRNLPALLAVACGMILSLAAFVGLRQLENQRAQAEFNRRVEQHVALLKEKVDFFEEMFLALRNFQIYAEPVSREEFRGMARDYLRRHQELHALHWAPKINASHRAALEAQVRSEGFPRFEFSELGPGPDRVPAAARPDYYPVLYVEPLAGNEAVLGADLFSGAAHRDWLETARDTGHITATGLTSPPGRGPTADVILVAAPVYHQNPDPVSPEQRRQLMMGFVVGEFHVSTMIENALVRARSGGLDVMFLDHSAPPATRVLHHHIAARDRVARVKRPEEVWIEPEFVRDIHVPVGGRDWSFVFRPAPDWRAAQRTWTPWGALLSGLCFTLLLGAYLLAAARRAEIVTGLVAQRTAELQDTNARLAEESRERQKAARAIGKSAVVLRATLESTADGILVVGPAGRIEMYNSQFRQMWGLPEEILAAGEDERAVRYVLQMLRQPTAFIAKIQEVYAKGETTSFDVLELKDGRIFERYSQPQFIEGKPAGRVWSFRDVTERQRATEALGQREQQLRNLVDTSQDLIWSVDAEGRWTFVNAAAKRIYGYDPAELVGHYFVELQTPEQAGRDLAVFERIKAGESIFQYETEHRRKDGSPLVLSFNAIVLRDEHGRVLGTTGTAADITERKRMEREQANINRKLLETQKLESLGVLAGGIAHDFNNLLTGILGNAGLARTELPSAATGHVYLEQIETATLRAADLCKQMLAYSGKGRVQVQRLSLNSLVEETVQLLQISISKKASLQLTLQPDLPAVAADPAQLNQVIMNLVINASEAIGDHPGIIALRTESVRVDRAYLEHAYMAPDLPEGEYVCLEVRDNGCGMSAEIQSRIFDPFFTTKFTGRGLGLAAVLGIVHGHGGALKVSSDTGRGTTFKMLLPRVVGPAEPTSPAPPPAAVWRGSGTVLVVDDEAAVRSVVASVLKRSGFDVVLAADGAEGVALFREQPEVFTVVLMDLTMPRLDGVEAFLEIRKIRPAARVVLMSGFSEQDAVQRFTGQGLAGFIQKPFRIATLREQMRVAMG